MRICCQGHERFLTTDTHCCLGVGINSHFALTANTRAVASDYIMLKCVLIVLLFIQLAQGQDSCETFCTCESSVAVCTAIPIFSSFLSTRFTTVIIRNSPITTLEVTRSDFPMLQTLTLRNCRLITCEEIQRQRNSMPNLIIDVDIECQFVTPGISTIASANTPTATDMPSSAYNMPFQLICVKSQKIRKQYG